MPTPIPQSFIEDLLTRIDITEIIGSRVKLRKNGSSLVGLCPFHAEKTPSFHVNPNKQVFHCFGCNAKGNAVTFIMQFEHMDFVSTIEMLAASAGLNIPRPDNHNPKDNLTPLSNQLKKVSIFYQQQLAKSTKAINYLKKRGLTGEICQKFMIGYASDSWDDLATISSTSRVARANLITAGMLIEKNQRAFARFRNRIMFPIHDVRGRIIGFGGRTLGDDPAKYLNSPETPLFHKSNELYGLYEAKQTKQPLTKILVVEGYMDTIALAQHGITNVVATLGTAITPKHIQLLLRHSNEIIFCFDGDQAGQKAAWRALEIILPLMREGITISFLLLPENHDPDSLIHAIGKEKFEDIITTALPLDVFLFQTLGHKLNLESIDGRSMLIKRAQTYLQKMPLGIFRQLLTDKLSKLVKLDSSQLSAAIIASTSQNYSQRQNTNPTATTSKPDSKLTAIPIQVQTAAHLLIHHPFLIKQLTAENLKKIKQLRFTGVELLVELLDLLSKQANLHTGAILEYWRDRPEYVLLEALASKEPIVPEVGLAAELQAILRSLYHLECTHSIRVCLKKASDVGLTKEEKIKLHQLILTTKNENNHE